MFTFLIQRRGWRTERNMEGLIQSASGTGERVPFGIGPGRAVDDGEALRLAGWAADRLARVQPPRGHPAAGLAQLIGGQGHDTSSWSGSQGPTFIGQRGG